MVFLFKFFLSFYKFSAIIVGELDRAGMIGIIGGMLAIALFLGTFLIIFKNSKFSRI
jgi:hypothetical protein